MVDIIATIIHRSHPTILNVKSFNTEATKMIARLFEPPVK
jgi:hypothetical protein